MKGVFMNGMLLKIMSNLKIQREWQRLINLTWIPSRFRQLNAWNYMRVYLSQPTQVLERQLLLNMQLLWLREIRLELSILHQLRLYRTKSTGSYRQSSGMLVW